MYELEKVYVDEDFVALKTTYNLRCGGYGGRLTEELRRQAAAKIRCPKTEATRRKMSISRTNKLHSEATKRKIGISAKGRLHSGIAREKMSQKARLRVDVGRGTIWISDGISNRRIDPTKAIVPEGWSKGRLIRSRGEMDIPYETANRCS